MHSVLPITGEQRRKMAEKILHLTDACPFDGCNPEYCPLHDVRKLSPVARREWVGILSDEDLDYLTVHDEICLQARTDQDLAAISRLNMDELAERIRFGIAEQGMHILSQNELCLILGGNEMKTDPERRMHVDNYCLQYGFLALHEEGCISLTLKKM